VNNLYIAEMSISLYSILVAAVETLNHAQSINQSSSCQYQLYIPRQSVCPSN